MVEVTFSNAAEADLVDIDAFSATRFGEDVAEAYMRGFAEAFARLADFPLIGQPVPVYGADLHCLTHRSHRIFYRLTGGEVHILRVLHYARDPRRNLGEG